MSPTREQIDQLRTLRAAFVDALPDLRRGIFAAYAELMRGPDDRGRLRVLQTLVEALQHRADSFGFTLISDAAANAEKVLSAWARDNTPLSLPDVEVLGTRLEQITMAIDRTPKGPVRAPPMVQQAFEAAQTEEAIDDAGLGRVLLVDDDAGLAEIITTELHARGFDVDTIADPALLWSAVVERGSSAIVFNQATYDGPPSGLAEYAKLNADRAEADLPPIPAVFSAVRNELDARLAVHRVGGSVLLARPLDFSDLAQQLRTMCRQHRTPLNALIVEDDKVSAQMYGRQLKKAGIKTRCVLDPRRVLEQLGTFEPDVIVLDIGLPGCSGIELAAVLRQDQRSQIPIVFLTAAGDSKTRRNAFGVGGDDFLAKPVDEAEFVQRVRVRAERFRSLERKRKIRNATRQHDVRGVLHQPGGVVLQLAARTRGSSITLPESFGVLATIDELVEGGHRRLALDWAGVLQAGSEVLACFLRKTEELAQRDVEMAFGGVAEALARAMSLIGLDRIPLAGTGDEALAALGGGRKRRERTGELTRDLKRAAQIQEQMLPTLPELPGFDVAVCYQPCSMLSGDFYDIYELGSGKLGIALGDATGHGVTAALVTSICKKLLKLSAHYTNSPLEALKAVNRELLGETDRSTFVTLLYGVLDTEARTFRFVRAGHEPLMLFNPERDFPVSSLVPPGIPLGVMGDRFGEQCEEQTVTLRPGDVCLLYSDGLTEARNAAGDLLASQGVTRALREAQPSASSVVGLLEQTVVVHQNGYPAEDDLTILAFSRARSASD